jgi:D-2-hydroxyacid dehydrogenase (NADP+)
LWKNEDIVITPHVGAFTREYKAKVSSLVIENIDRYRSGQTLHGIVDRSKGY